MEDFVHLHSYLILSGSILFLFKIGKPLVCSFFMVSILQTINPILVLCLVLIWCPGNRAGGYSWLTSGSSGCACGRAEWRGALIHLNPYDPGFSIFVDHRSVGCSSLSFCLRRVILPLLCCVVVVWC